ncbi:MAG: hypothetical protein IJV35_10810 [Neisseriaceae bacterium]|nr:hypothetical protein [Neisseriaceae bacterium]
MNFAINQLKRWAYLPSVFCFRQPEHAFISPAKRHFLSKWLLCGGIFYFIFFQKIIDSYLHL